MRVKELTVGDLMTRSVSTLARADSVAAADQRMRELDIRHLPIVDDQGHVIGIVSDRDVLRALAGGRGDQSVAAIMVEDVVTVAASNRAAEATLLFLDKKLGSLPVVDERRRLVGLITETDVVRLAHQLLGGEALSVEA